MKDEIKISIEQNCKTVQITAITNYLNHKDISFCLQMLSNFKNIYFTYSKKSYGLISVLKLDNCLDLDLRISKEINKLSSILSTLIVAKQEAMKVSV